MDLVQSSNIISKNSLPELLSESQKNLDNTNLNEKLESIFNLIINNNNQNLDTIPIPKDFATENLLNTFNFFFNKLNDISTIPNILEKRNDIFIYLSEILINNLEKIREKKDQEKISQFFYNINFFNIFLETLNKKDFSSFKETFVLFIQVSLILFIFILSQFFQFLLNDNLEINNLFKNKIIYELFEQYDSFKGMDIEDNTAQKALNEKKSKEILDKIIFIQNELKKNALINITNLCSNIQEMLNKRNLGNDEENKYSQYNDVRENLFNILSKEEISKDQNNSELIKMDNTDDKNRMEIEALLKGPTKEKENLGTKDKEEKKEEQMLNKKRTRERKKKEKNEDKEDNNKKKNKKKKVNNKENENNNINNSYKEKGVKKSKEENTKKKRSKKDQKQNNKNNNKTNNTNNIKSIKNENQRRKNSNSTSRKSKRNNNKTPNKKQEERKPSNKLIEEILKREFELNSKLLKQKDPTKNKQQINLDQAQNKETINEANNTSNINNNSNTNNNSPITNTNNQNIKPKYQKIKKKGKKRFNNVPLVIDEELKKSTPIRNLKKKPKSILKKNSPNPQLQIREFSPNPIKFQKAKSSDKKINLSSESKNKKFKTFAEIFQSPSKLKATPLKRKVNSEKKSNLKINNILTAEEKSEKKLGEKKRNISFNDERIVKEYNPKTPVRDVKQRMTRKSPLERKNRNDLIKQ